MEVWPGLPGLRVKFYKSAGGLYGDNRAYTFAVLAFLICKGAHIPAGSAVVHIGLGVYALPVANSLWINTKDGVLTHARFAGICRRTGIPAFPAIGLICLEVRAFAVAGCLAASA